MSPAWTAATGWADLDRGEPLGPGHAFPAYGITTVVTAVAVLRLVADGRLGLDEAANRYLGAVRLADDEVTVRQLLSHAGGVIDPPAPAVPDRAASDRAVRDPPVVIGPVIACVGKRGTYRFSAAGYAALGEIVSVLAGQPYPEAVSRLVLQPLAMTASWFPAGWPSPERAPAPVVTCYDVGAGGVFEAVQDSAAAVMAAGGLWSTAADLARFGLDWRSLLPRQLADQAVRPHVAITPGPKAGLGWLVNEPLGLAGQAGGARRGRVPDRHPGRPTGAGGAGQPADPDRTGQRGGAAGGGRIARRRRGSTLTPGGSGRLLIRGQGCKLTGFLMHGYRLFFPAR